MNLKAYLISLVFILSFVAFSVSVSNKGLRDLLQLRSQMSKTETHIHELEVSNRELRRKTDLLKSKSTDILEDQIRSSLGLVKPGELLYYE